MALAWAVLTLLTLAAVAALHWQTDRAPLPWARRLVATLLLGLGLWWIQHQITAQSAIEAQTGASYAEMIPIGALYLMASLGSLVVLFMVMLISVVESRMQSSLLQVQGTLDKHHLTDPLTQLPNRQCVEDQLPQLTLQADERHQNMSVLFLDLDGFKPINESFGHRFGDLLLQAVARRLVDQIGTQALVARWAADEFVVLADRHDTQEAVAALARQLLDALKQPIEIEGRDIPVAASIGIAVYPRDGAQSMLVAHADAAARSAKGSGGDTYCFFEPHMLQDIREQMELLKDLKLALEQSQLELYYQPKVHAPSGQITGAEGLLRWNHPVRGLISPNMFIPIAERFGLIGAMRNWVIDEACRQIREWRDGGLRMRVAINLSVHQMRQPGLAERIASALEAHGINPRLLTCEITESVAMEDTDSTKKLFASLAAVGVHLSIDDFGTGYSSLSYLRQLPAEELKIDRSFVVDIEQSEDARAVVDAVIKLGLALDLKVVAEGVETDGQYQVLRQLGCDELQGFLFARPMTAKMLYLWATIEKGADNIDFRPSLFADTQMHPLDAEPTRSP
ncbi:MAG: bifunctional diguanylate cyclase/phosphodiesterase [Burkholderiaceae bacterium]|nr:bifunctional diguanylate cyclase/phosphodiesterase [Burkholderiaceae bacterium]